VPIITGATLGPGFSINLNTSNNRTDWLSNNGAMLIMKYPADQAWGAVFVSQSQPAALGSRPGRDISGCQTLIVEVSGDAGTSVSIGIKDSTQPDDGSETKVEIPISNDWQQIIIPLSSFTGADLHRIYIPIEFVFGGPNAQTLRVRTVKLSATPATVTRVLPHFVYGAGWSSLLYLSNTSDQAQTVQLQFRGDDGQPLATPMLGGPAATIRLPARGATVLASPDSDQLSQGYIQISSASVVAGYGILRQTVDGGGRIETTIPFSDTGLTRSTLVWDDTDPSTTVVLLNPTTNDATVTATARDNSGAQIGAATLPLGAGTRVVSALRDLPGLAVVAGSTGTVDFSVAVGNVVVLAIRSAGQSMTALSTANR
jgi:hypothetical protein